MMTRLLAAFLLTGLLGSCAQPSVISPTIILPMDTIVPAPTSLSPSATPAATITPAPFTTNTPVIMIENPNPLPSPTATSPTINLPQEKVAILWPAPGSHLTSPIRVHGQAGPSWQSRIELRLVGEDGRLVSQSFAYPIALPGRSGPFSADIAFEIAAVAEAARLEVHNFSPVDGRLDHLASVDVTLLSVGTPRRQYALHGPEKLNLLSPRPDEVIHGGTIFVQGAGWTEANVPLTVEIHGEDDVVLDSAEVFIKSEGAGRLGTFEVQLTYQIESPQRGRIIIYEPSDTIPGMVHYLSVIINLRP